MKSTIIWYGLAMAILLGILKTVEYQFLLRDIRVEVYVGIVAVFFVLLGTWIGWKLTQKPEPLPSTIVEIAQNSAEPKPELLEKYRLSKREYEVLALIAQGFSNQEIAEMLFVSLNTIKTHSSNVFLKLDVKRRTQAVQKAKEIGLL
jgi:DNA-binding NarL/FixJ family response regulator